MKEEIANRSTAIHIFNNWKKSLRPETVVDTCDICEKPFGNNRVLICVDCWKEFREYRKSIGKPIRYDVLKNTGKFIEGGVFPDNYKPQP